MTAGCRVLRPSRAPTGFSEGPIGVGTTYVEPGPFGVRHGQVVTEFVPPARLSFEQPMSLKPKAFGVIGIQLFHTLTQGAGSVQVQRELQLKPRGIVRWMMPLIVPAFRAENERMMRALKVYAEGDRP
jgi:hypothetical protein